MIGIRLNWLLNFLLRSKQFSQDTLLWKTQQKRDKNQLFYSMWSSWQITPKVHDPRRSSISKTIRQYPKPNRHHTVQISQSPHHVSYPNVNRSYKISTSRPFSNSQRGSPCNQSLQESAGICSQPAGLWLMTFRKSIYLRHHNLTGEGREGEVTCATVFKSRSSTARRRRRKKRWFISMRA